MPSFSFFSGSAPRSTPEQRYQRLWRWHFYAGLFVMPLLLVLSITGTLYVFQPQIEALLYKDMLFIQPPAVNAVRLSYDQLAMDAEAALPPPSQLLRVDIDKTGGRSAEFVFRLPDGSKRSVYVNPYTGAVLGTLDVDRRFMQQVRMLHRQLLAGNAGGLIMELAATWTLVMLATGIALWWPQGKRQEARAQGRLWPRARLQGRAWWRDLHAALGIWFALGAMLFVLSGMPWTGSWGKSFKAIATQLSFGYPTGTRGSGHIHAARPGARTLDGLAFSETPWAVGATQVPQSGPDEHSAHGMHDHHDSGNPRNDMKHGTETHENGNGHRQGNPVNSHAGASGYSLDRAIAVLQGSGLTSGYELAVPTASGGVFSASYYPEDPRGQRTVHLDPGSYRILSQTGYAEYGWIARAISFGTALHMGRLFGLANQLICAAIALALGLLSATGLLLWWKRRPRGALFAAAPARRSAARVTRGWVAGLAILGVVFPLMGATLIAVALLDEWVFARPLQKSARAPA